MGRNIKAENLEKGMVIAAGHDGEDATVIRIRRIDHERGRLETDKGVAVVLLGEVFPIK